MKKKYYLCRKLERMIDKKDLNISHLTTMGLSCIVRRYIEFESEEELLDLIRNKTLLPSNFFMLGSGSNVLFPPRYEAIILHSAIKELRILNETEHDIVLQVGSGWELDALCEYAANHQWGGIENLSHIPGEMGAAAVQNVGAYGVEIKDVIQEIQLVEIATGKKITLDVHDCAYGYRNSIFKSSHKGRYIITSVRIILHKNALLQLEYGTIKKALQGIENPTVKDVREAIIAIRKTKLPEPCELGSVGSFFKNPVVATSFYKRLLKEYPTMPHYVVDDHSVKIPAAWLIDQRGWRGKAIGGAAVYDKQPLVLVNKLNASCTDFIQLKTAIQEDIFKAYGISLYPEAEFVTNP